MKLRTKFQDEDFDLGEVVEGVIVECLGKHEEKLRVIATAAKGGQHTFYYSSIKKFMDDWEDASEEPKEDGLDNIITLVEAYSNHDSVMYPKEIVDKLKAWKRLKDKGFRFEGWQDLEACDETERLVANRIVDGENIIGFRMDDYHDCVKDLNTCFGGEE